MSFASYLVFLFLLAAQCLAIPATSTDNTCLSACGKWAEVVAQCYQVHDGSPHKLGPAMSNSFLGCLCTGTNKFGQQYGNETMNQVAGVCQSCSTTPPTIKSDLSKFLGLCVIQAQNGTAANASGYSPLGYKTGKDANPDAKGVASAVSGSTTPSGVMLAALAVLFSSALATL